MKRQQCMKIVHNCCKRHQHQDIRGNYDLTINSDTLNGKIDGELTASKPLQLQLILKQNPNPGY
jgi:hypothetical protein